MLFNGNNIDILKDLENNSVDAVITDPPYGLKFMNKKWDYNVPSKDFWLEVLRVLKPGGHVLSFGGTRTYHRMAVNIEDAGFEIRAQVMWLYGSGFPKSHNIGKKIKDWDGWGTALKPANEPIVLARKPISEKTVVDNVLKWGTGALNIDGCRIKTSDKLSGGGSKNIHNGWGKSLCSKTDSTKAELLGRWPANIFLDDTAAEMLDEQSGQSNSNIRLATGKPKYTGSDKDSNAMRASKTLDNTKRGHCDSGGASRFFYVAKASKRERNTALDGITNAHPTVKPIKLMEYLVKLITPPNGVVLDPFMGSGSTGVACKNLGVDFIGIELDKEYFTIAKKRIENN